MKRLLAFIISFVYFFTSCTMSSPSDSSNQIIDYSSANYSGDDAVLLHSSGNGDVTVKSETMDKTFEISLKDENGETIEGYILSYTEELGEIHLFGFDPNGNYASISVRGSLDELIELGYITGSRTISTTTPINKNESDRSITVLTIVSIVLLISTVTVSSAIAYMHYQKVEEFQDVNLNYVFNGEEVFTLTYSQLEYYYFNHLESTWEWAKGVMQKVITFAVGEIATSSQYFASINEFINVYLVSLDVQELTLKFQELVDDTTMPEDLEDNLKNYVYSIVTTRFPDKTDSEIRNHTYYLVDFGPVTNIDDPTSGVVCVKQIGIFWDDPRLNSISGKYQITSDITGTNTPGFFTVGHSDILYADFIVDGPQSFKIFNLEIPDRPSQKFYSGAGIYNFETDEFSGEVVGYDNTEAGLDSLTFTFDGLMNSPGDAEGTFTSAYKFSYEPSSFDGYGDYAAIRIDS